VKVATGEHSCASLGEPPSLLDGVDAIEAIQTRLMRWEDVNW
jgi:hypothetical protein